MAGAMGDEKALAKAQGDAKGKREGLTTEARRHGGDLEERLEVGRILQLRGAAAKFCQRSQEKFTEWGCSQAPPTDEAPESVEQPWKEIG